MKDSSDKDNRASLTSMNFIGQVPERIEKSLQSLVPDLQGRFAITITYVMLAYMYGLTLLCGIWNMHGDIAGDRIEPNTGWAVISTLIFTFLFIMTILSHCLTVVTSPG